MRNSSKQARIRNGVEILVILSFCVATLLLQFLDIRYSTNERRNHLFSLFCPQLCGVVAAVLLVRRLGMQKLFGKPQNWLYFLPCVVIALNNFQWIAYFGGKMELATKNPIDFLLFLGYCFAVGLFEELVFRGVLFGVLANLFPANKKGFLWTYVTSSLLFGLSHLFNGLSLATLLQVGYTVLTGGLFAFCLIKTKNVLCCAFVHGLYNFCGLLFDKQGLGTGVVFDVGTCVLMASVTVVVGIFVLYHVFRYTDEEREELYERLL